MLVCPAPYLSCPSSNTEREVRPNCSAPTGIGGSSVAPSPAAANGLGGRVVLTVGASRQTFTGHAAQGRERGWDPGGSGAIVHPGIRPPKANDCQSQVQREC
jgi:hypothetical protein